MNADDTLILCRFFVPCFSLRVGGQGVGWTASQPSRRNAAADGVRLEDEDRGERGVAGRFCVTFFMSVDLRILYRFITYCLTYTRYTNIGMTKNRKLHVPSANDWWNVTGIQVRSAISLGNRHGFSVSFYFDNGNLVLGGVRDRESDVVDLLKADLRIFGGLWEHAFYQRVFYVYQVCTTIIEFNNQLRFNVRWCDGCWLMSQCRLLIGWIDSSILNLNVARDLASVGRYVDLNDAHDLMIGLFMVISTWLFRWKELGGLWGIFSVLLHIMGYSQRDPSSACFYVGAELTFRWTTEYSSWGIGWNTVILLLVREFGGTSLIGELQIFGTPITELYISICLLYTSPSPRD